jgi:hypothetical protein
MFSIKKIKVWAESSANTLLLQADVGSYDESTDQLQIRSPTYKELKQKTLADNHTGMIVYVDGETHALYPAATGQPMPKHAPPVPPRFSRRKMKMSLSGQVVVLKSAP